MFIGAHRKGVFSFEWVAICAGIAILGLCVSSYLRKHQDDSGDLDRLVEENKKNAELVIVGKITNVSSRFDQNQERGEEFMMGYGFWDIDIEKVERGSYPGNRITVYIGWTSNLAPTQFYSPWVKKNYRSGNRIRIYLYYIGKEGREDYVGPSETYTALAAYYGVEPLF